MDDDHHHVKQEPHENPCFTATPTTHIQGALKPPTFIDLSSSSDDRNSNSEHDLNDFIDSILNGKGKMSVDSDDVLSNAPKKQTFELPIGFLDPLPPLHVDPAALVMSPPAPLNLQDELTGNAVAGQSCKQFWKAGDYEGAQCGDWESNSVGMNHVRIHPKFLHSNATSHKWALGAFAELLDNALDEIYSGATYANIDMLQSNKDSSKMLLIEDNGGGMDPDKVRQCMSLGYSVKSKIANTIGQYGNGFKTSTMRLGADVIVFSRCGGKDGKCSTQSIGLLSYTFLRSTGKEDIVVPMLDYKKEAGEWNKIIRSTIGDWIKNVETIVQWSPFSNEAELLQQFNLIKEHGTRIIIYNLWEDDQGLLELDFDTDKYDIFLRGVNKDEKNIQMANRFPNSRHFLTYKHSLRSYASILYRRIAPGFRIILRGKDVEHHSIVNDMMISQEVVYRPQTSSNGINKNSNMLAIVSIGFVKDAVHHIDVQGFNVYHKNRLIKPFWRVWNSTGSDGRGVIGVLEANFIEPAHDKQGFERTNVLSRLETRLIQMQKTYWYTYCHKIGYSKRINRTSPSQGTSSSSKMPISDSDKFHTSKALYEKFGKGQVSSKKKNELKAYTKGGCSDGNELNASNFNSITIDQLKNENRELMESLKKLDYDMSKDLLLDIQHVREKCKLVESQLQETQQKIKNASREQGSLIQSFTEERDRRCVEEEKLRKNLKEATNTIQELLKSSNSRAGY